MLKIAWSESYCHTLPEGHRFPMIKYELIPEQLLYEGSISESQIFSPGILSDKNALITHDLTYFNNLLNQALDIQEIRRIGFPLTPELVLRELQITQGTIECCFHAIQFGVAFNVAGGTHHAFKSAGEGFCLLNDIAVASNFLLANDLRKRILIIDLDVHQGNGTANIFEESESVYTFSVHGQNNFPLRKEKSRLDVGLPDGISDNAYLKILDLHIEPIFQRFEPDFVFYQSGVDILETDRLGRLKVSKDGCKKRDEKVFSICKKNNVPIVVVMGGGYSFRIQDIVDAHCNTFRSALHLFS